MRVSSIEITNYRLLQDAKLDLDAKTTVIVGRNNTGKTSLLHLLNQILDNKPLFYNDFPKYAPMIPQESYPEDKKDSYIRNRNLFYVCCSRPKKRLIIFISVPVDATFKRFLVDLVGESNYYTYSEYIDMLTSQN